MSDNDIPQQFLCPITLEIMFDPVICEDGHTYERQAILNLKNNLSPITRQPINKINLIPNRALKELIHTYVEKHNIELPNIQNTQVNTIKPSTSITTILNITANNEILNHSNSNSNSINNQYNNINILITSFQGKQWHININDNDIIRSIKHKLYMCDGIPCIHQRLVFNGKQLEDYVKIKDYGIRNDSQIKILFMP